MKKVKIFCDACGKDATGEGGWQIETRDAVAGVNLMLVINVRDPRLNARPRAPDICYDCALKAVLDLADKIRPKAPTLPREPTTKMMDEGRRVIAEHTGMNLPDLVMHGVWAAMFDVEVNKISIKAGAVNVFHEEATAEQSSSTQKATSEASDEARLTVTADITWPGGKRDVQVFRMRHDAASRT